MSARLVICVFFAVSVACASPNAAVAANCPYFARGGFTPWTYLSPSVYALEQPPYFALHPPVYYSYPVSRPYGHLPYPYLPAPPSRSVAQAGPMVVRNPYVTREAGETVVTLPQRVQVVRPAEMASQPQ